MVFRKRQFDLSIWGLALGYFVFYIPYAGLIKALTTGVISGAGGRVSGFELLPSTTLATASTMFIIITGIGWWKYAGRRALFGVSVPVPSRLMFLSGFGTAIIIGTTTLAYTFSGISIVFALILLRGGVLIIAPVVDAAFKRKVRWFSWAALALSFVALAVALADVNNYKMTTVAAINIAGYLTGYMLRLPCMTALAKSTDKDATKRYFVEEQIVAQILLVGIPAILALVGQGEIMLELRHGFTTFWGRGFSVPALSIGSLYACLCVFGTLIYLDRRENTFCIPLNRCSSLLSGIVASYALVLLFDQKPPSMAQLNSAGLITLALLFLSPLHHVGLYFSKLNHALRRLAARLSLTGFAQPKSELAVARQPQRIFLFVCSGNTCRSAMAEAIGKVETASRLKIPFESVSGSGINVLSAGVTANPGRPMTTEAQEALRKLGMHVPAHATRLLTLEMVDQAEVIYCMTRAQCEAVIELFPSAAMKAKCLDPNGDIEDPIGAALEVFLQCAERIRALVRFRFDELGLQAKQA